MKETKETNQEKRYAVYWDGGGKYASRMETDSRGFAERVYDSHLGQRPFFMERW